MTRLWFHQTCPTLAQNVLWVSPYPNSSLKCGQCYHQIKMKYDGKSPGALWEFPESLPHPISSLQHSLGAQVISPTGGDATMVSRADRDSSVQQKMILKPEYPSSRCILLWWEPNGDRADLEDVLQAFNKGLIPGGWVGLDPAGKTEVKQSVMQGSGESKRQKKETEACKRNLS